MIFSFWIKLLSTIADLSPNKVLWWRQEIFSLTKSKSEMIISILIISTSLCGSTLLYIYVIPLILKHLKIWQIAFTSLIFDKIWLPNLSLFDAPFTKPAMSINWQIVGIVFGD